MAPARGKAAEALTLKLLKQLLIAAQPSLKPRFNELKQQEALHHCWHKKLITEEQLYATVSRSVSTIKCYLTSTIDKQLLPKVEQYVLWYSALWRRGSIFANLLAADCLHQVHTVRRLKTFDHYDPAAPVFRSETLADFQAILGSEDLLKQLFLPERYPTSVGTPLHALIDQVYQRDTLSFMVPGDWDEVITRDAMNNAFNHMGTVYAGHIQVKLYSQLEKTLGRYFKHCHLEDSTYRKKMWGWTQGVLRPLTIHNQDYELLRNIRGALAPKVTEMDSGARVSTTPATAECQWKRVSFRCAKPSASLLHLLGWFAQQGVSVTLLPECKRSRCFAYINLKMVQSFLGLPQKGTGTLQDLLGLSPTAYDAKRKQLRQTMRRQTKHSSSLRTSRRWQRHGISKMPRDAEVVSIHTDGVGMGTIKRPDMQLLHTIRTSPPPPLVAKPKGKKKGATAPQPLPQTVPIFDCP
eukprot:jgi/Chrzof1/8006/UNPLg00057.t1